MGCSNNSFGNCYTEAIFEPVKVYWIRVSIKRYIWIQWYALLAQVVGGNYLALGKKVLLR